MLCGAQVLYTIARIKHREKVLYIWLQDFPIGIVQDFPILFGVQDLLIE